MKMERKPDFSFLKTTLGRLGNPNLSLPKVDFRIVGISDPLRKVWYRDGNLPKGPGLKGELLESTFGRDRNLRPAISWNRWSEHWTDSVKQWNRLSPTWLVPLILAIALLIMLGVRVVAAQAPTPSDDDVNAVARELYCPVCENIPLDVCPTTACAQWRDLIRLKLSQGQTKEQIKQYFVAQYGDRVLAEPPQTGLNWLVYGLPPVIFLVGVYLVYRGLRGVHAFQARRQKPADAATVPATVVAPAAPQQEPPADPYLARVEEELRKRE